MQCPILLVRTVSNLLLIFDPGLFYASGRLYCNRDSLRFRSGFASPPLRLFQVGSPPDTITARRFCVTSILAACFTAGQAACPFCCNMASLRWQKGLLRETIRTHMFSSIFLVISSFTHHSAHRIARTTDSFPSLHPFMYIDNYISH